MATDNNDDEKSGQRWFPLESNPVLMNEYCKSLGFDTSVYSFVDVFSYEEWALEMIPQPVQALVMLYPLTDKQLSYIDPTTDIVDTTNVNNNIWFIKQRIGNACGTIGILHSIINLLQKDSSLVASNSWMEQFMIDTPVQLGSIEKSERLENDTNIAKLHDNATSSIANQTNRGTIDDKVETHFISFVPVVDPTSSNTYLYELDGRKSGPINHGITTTETFLYDSCQIVQKFMSRDPNEIRFTMLALAPTIPSEE